MLQLLFRDMTNSKDAKCKLVIRMQVDISGSRALYQLIFQDLEHLLQNADCPLMSVNSTHGRAFISPS